jgi:hypothetical protein
MAAPAIIWRNPTVVQRRRLWNRARRDDSRRLYIVVRSGPGAENEWEGMPNLEVLEGGAPAQKRANRSTHSRA